jgi:hypothetical protein
MCIVLLLDKMLYRCLLCPFGLEFLCWFILSVWPICWWQWNIEVSHNNCVEVCLVYSFKYSSVCLMKLGTLILCTYKLMNVISSWCVVHFMSKKWISLSLFTNSGLKLTNLYLLMG